MNPILRHIRLTKKEGGKGAGEPDEKNLQVGVLKLGYIAFDTRQNITSLSGGECLLVDTRFNDNENRDWVLNCIGIETKAECTELEVAMLRGQNLADAIDDTICVQVELRYKGVCVLVSSKGKNILLAPVCSFFNGAERRGMERVATGKYLTVTQPISTTVCGLDGTTITEIAVLHCIFLNGHLVLG